MAEHTTLVRSTEELLVAIDDEATTVILVGADLEAVPSLRLRPLQSIRSSSDGRATLRFCQDVDGLQVSSDNTISGLDLLTSPDRCAIWNDRAIDDLGTLRLHALQTVGRVQIIAKDRVRKGHIEVHGLDVLSADTRGEPERPHAYGVSVLQGAVTLWNAQHDTDVVLTADLTEVSVGRFRAPVFGSGVLIGGAGTGGGRLNVRRLETRAIFVDGQIPAGTADEIAGGVFAVHGAYIDTVTNLGAVVTYGVNDMALDNWGVVDRWIAREKVTTFGASAIGFVNFGSIRDLRVEAPIETFGPGARGFNVYDGTVGHAEFDRIVTHADGAVGAQISQPIGTMVVRRGIETFGGDGPSLVKGVVQNLSAIALSIKPDGRADVIRIEGGLRTHAHDVLPLEQRGAVRHLVVDGGCGGGGAV